MNQIMQSPGVYYGSEQEKEQSTGISSSDMVEKEWGDQSNGDKNEDGGLIVAVGINGGRRSKYILKWALDRFVPESKGNVTFKLIYVYPRIISVPTSSLMDIWAPIEKVRPEIAAGYRQEIERKKKKLILPFQEILKARLINSDIIMLESDDIAMAITSAIERHLFRHLAVGVSTTPAASIFSRKTPKNMSGDKNISTVITETAPDFCSVYIISDGKLQHMREATSEPPAPIHIQDIIGMSTVSTDSSPDNSSLTLGSLLKTGASSPIDPRQTTLKSLNVNVAGQKLPEFHQTNKSESKRLSRESSVKHHTYSNVKATENASYDSQGLSNLGSWTTNQTSPVRSFARSSFVGTPPTGSFVSTPRSGYYVASGSYVGTQQSVHFVVGTPPMGSFVDTPPPGSSISTPTAQRQSPRSTSTGALPHEVSQQLEILRNELRRIEHMYESPQNSDINEKPDNLSKQRLEETIEVKEKAEELTSTKKSKSKTAQNAAASELAVLRSSQTREEREAAYQAKELVPVSQYQKFTWDEIVASTSSFSEEFKIGMGAFGTVYKCKLHHTTVAVKVLHCKNNVADKQFLQELEILSSIRHPHLLLLLGAVPRENCLVYEYMENGSLEDRLFRRKNKPPLPWYDRFRICWEVASSLTFLHSTKPQPIIHRDLKPANILLDQNLVSKIGDAGLGTMLNAEQTTVSMKTRYKETSPVGTFCYIDPEYQRTGRVSTKSDIYALGVVILQLLTAKPAVGVAYIIEDAIDEGNMMELLDPEAGEWPEQEAYNLAILGLQCAELRGRDRPDLREHALPLLEKLKDVANRAKESALRSHTAMPTHFICPILKDIMEDPYVAADGYTYDRTAIEEWLRVNDTSPTTNLPIPHKFIMPNYTLLEAVNQWKAKRPLE